MTRGVGRPILTDMKDTKDTPKQPGPAEDDAEGQGLLLDTDYYIARKPRDPETERHAAERRQAKETRTTKPERRH